MNKTFFKTIFMFMAILASSCEKLEMGEETEVGTKVVFTISAFEQIPFDGPSSDEMAKTRAGEQDIADICSRLNFAIFRGDEKIKSIAQKASEAEFGKISLVLPEGSYSVVIIAHNANGSATITSPEKVTFPNNVVTDMFYHYEDLNVGSTGQSHDVVMKRAVSMFRLLVTDEIPHAVAKMKFYYTGGSSTFNPTTGYGSVNSRQTVVLDVEEGETTAEGTQFDVFTCLHAQRGSLKITVTALDETDNELYQKEFVDVDMSRNSITRYTGAFFGSGGGGSGGSGSSSFSMRASSEWSDTQDKSF